MTYERVRCAVVIHTHLIKNKTLIFVDFLLCAVSPQQNWKCDKTKSRLSACRFNYQYISSRNIQHLSHTQQKAYIVNLVPEDQGEEECSSIPIITLFFLMCVDFSFSSTPPLLPATAHLPFAMALFTVGGRNTRQEGRMSQDCRKRWTTGYYYSV